MYANSFNGVNIIACRAVLKCKYDQIVIESYLKKPWLRLYFFVKFECERSTRML